MEGAGVLHATALLPPLKSLCWYTEIDPEKVRRLQALLNQMELGDQLLEDGVYGKETRATWLHFLNVLEHGVVPMLAWIDPLQSERTGLEISGNKGGLNNVIRDSGKGTHHFRVAHHISAPKVLRRMRGSEVRGFK